MLCPLINGNAAPRGVDYPLQQVAATFGFRRCSHPSARQHPVQERDGDQRENDDFGDAHDRLLILIVCGRSGSVANDFIAECEVAHTRRAK